jgi:hypothetical protein
MAPRGRHLRLRPGRRPRLDRGGPPGEVAARTAASPDVYEAHYGLSIRLDRVDPDELRRLVGAAYVLALLRTDRPGRATPDLEPLAALLQGTEC